MKSYSIKLLPQVIVYKNGRSRTTKEILTTPRFASFEECEAWAKWNYKDHYTSEKMVVVERAGVPNETFSPKQP